MSMLNVRINHKYDTFEAWQSSTIILNKGELAVVEIPSGAVGSKLTPPAVGVKIGDGKSLFKDLPWIQSTAGDVYAWAKAETKPEYNASEITGLSDYISGEIQDTNTTYRFSYANDTLTVEHREVTAVDSEGNPIWTKLVDLPISLTTKVDKDTDAVAGNLAQFVEGGNIVDSGEKISDFMKTAAADAKYATKDELAATDEAASDLAERVTTAEGEIDDLQDEVNTLKGTGEGSVKKTVDDAINKFATDVTNDEVVNSYKELIDYVAEHGPEAAEMAAGIEANKNAIAALEETDHTHSNKAELDLIKSGDVAKWDAIDGALRQHVADREAVLNKAITDAQSAAEGHADQKVKELADGQVKTNSEAIAENAEAISTLDAAAVKSISGVTGTKTGNDFKVTAVPVNILQNVEGDTLVFNCGTSSTVI